MRARRRELLAVKMVGLSERGHGTLTHIRTKNLTSRPNDKLCKREHFMKHLKEFTIETFGLFNNKINPSPRSK